MIQSPLVIADPKVPLNFWNERFSMENFGRLMQDRFVDITDFLTDKELVDLREGMDWLYKLNFF